MKNLGAAVLLVIGVATIMVISERRITGRAPADQCAPQPLFLDYTSEFDLVPAANTQLSFQNPVRIRNINYPWVQVEPLPAPPAARQGGTEIWINMDFIAAVRKRH